MSDTLHPTSAVTPEERARQAKAAKKKAQLELEKSANQPLLNALNPKQKGTWKPGGASLPMLPDRLNKKGDTLTADMSYITAHKMDMSLLKKHLGWLDTLEASAYRSCKEDEQMTQPHKTAVALYQKLETTEIHLPQSIRTNEGSTEEELENVLRRRCNEVYFQYIEKAIRSRPQILKKIFWDSEKPEGSEWSFGNKASSAINENALLTLFIQRPITQETSEMEVERIVGNFFMQILQGSSREMEMKMSSATDVRYFMPFSAFGIRPRPDCVIQITTDHPLLMPISIIAEAKASDNVKGEFGPVAQIAGVVHSTLAFLVFTWCLRHPGLSLPSEAVLPGIAYSRGRVHIYAFYAFVNNTTHGRMWNFRGFKLYTSIKALAEMSVYEKAVLMSQMLLIQNAAYRFGKWMKQLIEETYVASTASQTAYVRDSILKAHMHTEDDQKAVQQTMEAFTRCIGAWQRLYKIELDK